MKRIQADAWHEHFFLRSDRLIPSYFSREVLYSADAHIEKSDALILLKMMFSVVLQKEKKKNNVIKNAFCTC